MDTTEASNQVTRFRSESYDYDIIATIHYQAGPEQYVIATAATEADAILITNSLMHAGLVDNMTYRYQHRI